MSIAATISLSPREREGARCASNGKGEGDLPACDILSLPALRASLPLLEGEG